MFPLFLNLSGRLGVVVGGGPVGWRKAQALLQGGAAVRLVCLEPSPTEEMDPSLEWITAPYQAGHLDGASLVLAAATPPINAQVVAEARRRGLWVNSATDPQQGDLFLPSVVRRGDMMIAVGTAGKAPALARAVRLLLEEQLDAAFSRWAELLAELRPIIQEMVPEPSRRRELLRRFCTPAWLERLRQEGPEPVRQAMLRQLGQVLRPSDGER
jgi:precorrin-2 dehydrogenase/sirohydrochlorin ferrochelatase